jgi:hypothetical protein
MIIEYLLIVFNRFTHPYSDEINAFEPHPWQLQRVDPQVNTDA